MIYLVTLLRLLFTYLQDDIPWEWEQVFTEVSSELLAETDQQENPEEWPKYETAASLWVACIGVRLFCRADLDLLNKNC